MAGPRSACHRSPAGTSIASSSAAVAARTVIVYGGKLWSKSSESSIWRGWPPVNSGSVNDVPVTFSYFHSLLSSQGVLGGS